ncbi:MAG: CPBP family intramembrane glutamic endopeptidase [Bdellovibrionota bacterium]
MLRALLVLILGSLFVSGLISPSIYSLIKYLFPEITWPYSRVFDRILMVVIFIFLLILKKDFSIKEAVEKFRVRSKKGALKDFLKAFSISLFVSIILMFFLDLEGKFVWGFKDFNYYLAKIIKVIFTAIIISILEEGFFRVILLNSFKRRVGIFWAMFFSSLCYSCAHFIVPAKAYKYSKLSLTVGFEYYIEVLKTMFFPDILFAFIGLFLLGFVLCLIMQRFSSIYINIGLHSGWVMAMKLFIFSIAEAPNVAISTMERRYFLVSQGLGWLSVILVFAISYIVFSKSSGSFEDDDARLIG